MLTRIYADNFRCFSNLELRPQRINLLLGPNGSGKSSLFEVITALVRLTRSAREVGELFPPSSLTRWDTRLEQRFELDLQIDDCPYCYTLRVAHEGETGPTVIVEERVTQGDKTLFAYANGVVNLHRNNGTAGAHFPFRPTRSFLAEMEARPENTSLMNLLEYLGRTRVLKLVPSSIGSVTQEENASLRSDGADFASWYRHISQESPGELHDLFNSLREIIPGFHSLTLAGAGKQGRTRDLVVKIEGPSQIPYAVDFDDLSDGQRVLVVLYTLLLDIRRGSGLVLLDEPENYVSLPEIQPWAVALSDALGDGGQLMLISHHPGVIDYLAAERPLLFTRDGAGPVRVSDPGFSRDEGLRASEQIARGLIDGK